MTRDMLARQLRVVIWPAFVVAGLAEFVFFAIFDPFELHFFGAPLDLSREAIYTLGFFGFWGMGIASSTLTVLLARPAFDVNRHVAEPVPPAGTARACCKSNNAT